MYRAVFYDSARRKKEKKINKVEEFVKFDTNSFVLLIHFFFSEDDENSEC